MRNYAIITTDSGRRGSRRTMATGAATTMDNNNHILFWKLYEGIASIFSIRIRICFCMCICICNWVCLLFVDERIVRAFLYSPIAVCHSPFGYSMWSNMLWLQMYEYQPNMWHSLRARDPISISAHSRIMPGHPHENWSSERKCESKN